MAATGEKSDVSLELALVNMEFAVMESDARCLIQALNSSSGQESYGGTSNSTEAGRMVLQQRLQALTREKAQLRQKKAALEQQQHPSGPLVHDAAAAVAAAGAAKGNDGKTVIPCPRGSATSDTPKRWIVEHHSSATPTAPAGTQNAAFLGGAEESKHLTADQKAVAATTILWKDTVTSGTVDAPRKTADLYSKDATLWGTVSEEVRHTPEQIYAYYDYFARLPKLRVVEYTSVAVRVYGDFAVQAGIYTFAWEERDGTPMEKRARFSLTFRREHPGTCQEWTIVEHHSSSMSTAPAGLKRIGPAAAEPQQPASEITPDQKAVAKATVVWKNTVTLGTEDAPSMTAALYAPDAVFWGTASEEVRETPEQIYDYFDYFARLPGLRMVEYTPSSVRVYGQFAVQAGTYTFQWQAEDGSIVEKQARFSFTFRRDNPGSPQPWTIVEHHSSSMSTAPPGPIGSASRVPAASTGTVAGEDSDRFSPVFATSPGLKLPSSAVRFRSPGGESGGRFVDGSAPSSSPSTAAYSPLSDRDQDQDQDTVLNEPGSEPRAARRRRAHGAHVDYLRFPATQQDPDKHYQGPPAAADTDTSESLYPPESPLKAVDAAAPGASACSFVCGAVATAALFGLVNLVVAPMFSSSEHEPAPVATVAAANAAVAVGAVGAAIAARLAPVGKALSRM